MYHRVLPILFAFKRVAFIAETYALILAICEINIEVLCKCPRAAVFGCSFGCKLCV
jgi:hypothetical protein